MLTETSVAALMTAFLPERNRGKVVGRFHIRGRDQYGNPQSETILVREYDSHIESRFLYQRYTGHFELA